MAGIKYLVGIRKKVGAGLVIQRLLSTRWTLAYQGKSYVIDFNRSAPQRYRWEGREEFGSELLARARTAEAVAEKIAEAQQSTGLRSHSMGQADIMRKAGDYVN